MPVSRRVGFTLIELSVVLAIIGLLIGGVMAGQAMMNNQRVLKTAGQAKNYMIAMQQFKDKYGFFPGDFPTATTIWGRSDGGTPVTSNCASSLSDSAVATGTCNGDGDGIVGRGIYSQVQGWQEGARAWQQLSLAKMIVGNYSGVPTIMGGTLQVVADRSAPSSELPASIFTLGDWGLGIFGGFAANPPFWFGANYNNSLTLGSTTPMDVGGGSNVYLNPLFSGANAYGIDAKYDDASPATGKIVVPGTGFNPNCTVTSGGTVEYLLMSDSPACSIIFLNGFGTPRNAAQ